MVKTLYDGGVSGLAILLNGSQADLYFVDEDLHKIGKTICLDDGMADFPKDIINGYLEATEKYFRGTKYPQFKELALKQFYESDYYRELLEEAENE